MPCHCFSAALPWLRLSKNRHSRTSGRPLFKRQEQLESPSVVTCYNMWPNCSLWPTVFGAVTKEVADRYIDKYLLNDNVLLTAHPISTISKSDLKFEQRMW